MLYIRKRISQSRWVVFDTDDNTAQEVTMRDLEKAVKLGLEIEGLSFRYEVRGGRRFKYISGVEVVRGSDQVSSVQTKLRVLKGVEFCVANKRVVGVKWGALPSKTGTVLRVSDYFTVVSNYVLDECGSMSEGNLTLVLDDKLKFHLNSFCYFYRHKITIDVSEVSNNALVWAIYKEGLSCEWGAFPYSHIRDNTWRRSMWRCVLHVIGRDPLQLSEISPEIWGSLYELMYPWLIKGFEHSFHSISRSTLQSVCIKYIEMLREHRRFWFSDLTVDDYDKVYELTSKFIENMTYICMDDVKYLIWFKRAADMCSPSDRLKADYVRFFCLGNRWLLQTTDKRRDLVPYKLEEMKNVVY